VGHVPKGGILGRGIAEVPAGEDYQECQACEKGTAADRKLEVCVEMCPEGTNLEAYETSDGQVRECVKTKMAQLQAASEDASPEESLFQLE